MKLSEEFLVISLIYIQCCGSSKLEINFVYRTENEYIPEALYNAAVSTKTERVCNKPACIQAASMLVKNMDPDVDPCEDFYDFACGSFLKNTRIPDDKIRIGSFDTLSDAMTDQLQNALEESTFKDEPRTFSLAKTLYQACMNTDMIEARGIQPLLVQLQLAGDWPVFNENNWDESTFSWQDSIYRLHSAGFSSSYFFGFSVEVDQKNSSRRIIDLGSAALGLGREELVRGFSDKLVQAYYDYMVDVVVLLGADRTRALQQLNESLHFEMMLAKISLPLLAYQDPNNIYHPMSIAELMQYFPSIPWLEYINRLLEPHKVVDLDEIVNVVSPQYLAGLEALLKTIPKSTQANYIMWGVVQESITYLTNKLRQRELMFQTRLDGNKKRESRGKECTKTVIYYMKQVVGAMFTRNFFDKRSKPIVEELVDDVRQRFRQSLSELDWMDDETRVAALKKAETIEPIVAYPNELLNDEKINEIHPNLQISKDHYLESTLKARLSARQYKYTNLHQPVNRTSWREWGGVAFVNAQYSPTSNVIYIPAGILNGVFFTADRPAYMNFGGIGSVIGHEIGHAFDTSGRKYDSQGNLNDWWKECTAKKYLEKAQCMIDQYSNFTVKEIRMKVNGSLTITENIADNGGYMQAYYAYQDWVNKHGEEPRLPGLEKYSPNQMFWLSISSVWCGLRRDESAKLRIQYDVHSPPRFRINGPLSNSAEFARDFKCPLGSPMNPSQKCVVW